MGPGLDYPGFCHTIHVEACRSGCWRDSTPAPEGKSLLAQRAPTTFATTLPQNRDSHRPRPQERVRSTPAIVLLAISGLLQIALVLTISSFAIPPAAAVSPDPAPPSWIGLRFAGIELLFCGIAVACTVSVCIRKPLLSAAAIPAGLLGVVVWGLAISSVTSESSLVNTGNVSFGSWGSLAFTLGSIGVLAGCLSLAGGLAGVWSAMVTGARPSRPAAIQTSVTQPPSPSRTPLPNSVPSGETSPDENNPEGARNPTP